MCIQFFELLMDENDYYWPSKRVGKMVGSKGKVSEKSGSLEMGIEWQPSSNILRLKISHNFCHLFFHLLMFSGSLYCKQYRLRSDCSFGSSLIRVHIVCFD